MFQSEFNQNIGAVGLPQRFSNLNNEAYLRIISATTVTSPILFFASSPENLLSESALFMRLKFLEHFSTVKSANYLTCTVCNHCNYSSFLDSREGFIIKHD